MTTDLIISNWYSRFEEAIRLAREEILLVAPFIHLEPLRLLLARTDVPIRVLTRFDTRAFYEKVSSLDALRFLLERGAQIKGIKHLHTKLYVVDRLQAFITSANLTWAAFHRNPELGVATRDPQLVGEARKYFDDHWERAGALLTSNQLDAWQEDIASVAAEVGPPHESLSQLGDHGAELVVPVPASSASRVMDERDVFANPPQWFVKFSGTSDNRAPRSMPVREAARYFGLHSACYYPKPSRRVQDGAVMFLARLVKKPKDIMIFGRALGQAYVDGRDGLSEAALRARGRESRWPHVIRIHDMEGMDGALEQGVSLYELMDELKAESFRSTSDNAARGNPKTNPRRCLRKSHVQLTPRAAAWVTERLVERMRVHGRLTADAFAWPQ